MSFFFVFFFFIFPSSFLFVFSLIEREKRKMTGGRRKEEEKERIVKGIREREKNRFSSRGRNIDEHLTELSGTYLKKKLAKGEQPTK